MAARVIHLAWPSQSSYSDNQCRENATRRPTSRISSCARSPREFADGQALAPHAHPWGQLIYAAVRRAERVDRAGLVGGAAALGGVGAGGRRARHAIHRRGVAAHALSAARPRRSADAERRHHGVAAAARTDPARGRDRHARRPRADPRRDGRSHPARTAPTRRRRSICRCREARCCAASPSIGATPDDRSGHAALAKRFGVGVRTLERGFVAETGLSLGRCADKRASCMRCAVSAPARR